MEFTISCECGTKHTVSEGAAGTRISCPCGRSINVGSLAQLRMTCGLSAVPLAPEARIRAMLANGELPVSQCLKCGSPCNDATRFVAKCEQEHTSGSGRYEWITYLVPFGSLFRSKQLQTVVHGRETIVSVPIALCTICKEAYLVRGSFNHVRIAALILGAIGIALLWVSVDVALATLTGAVLAFMTAIFLSWRAQASWRRLLCNVAVYDELFRRFPDASITFEE